MQTLADYKRFFVEEGREEGEENLSFCLDRMERNSSIKLNFVGKIGNLKKDAQKKGFSYEYLHGACMHNVSSCACIFEQKSKQTKLILPFILF